METIKSKKIKQIKMFVCWSERVNSIPYIELLNEVEKDLYTGTSDKRYLYGLSENMNVFLSGLEDMAKVT
jgi:hypothetical protein